jgi:hypothetical protein
MLAFYLLCSHNLNDMIALWEEKRVDISPCLLTCFEIINSKIQKQFRSLPFLSSSFTHCCGHRVEECIAGAEGGMVGALDGSWGPLHHAARLPAV